jgi:hypothetical protein
VAARNVMSMDTSRILNFIIADEVKVFRIVKHQYTLQFGLQNQYEAVEE